MDLEFSIEPVAECSLLIRFVNPVSATLSVQIGELASEIMGKFSGIVINVTPSYQTILVDYLPYRMDQDEIIPSLRGFITACYLSPECLEERVELPAYYHHSVGPELALYEHDGLTLQDVIRLHSEAVYTVCAIGFAPGFAFMTDVAEPLRKPRLKTPRLRVPAGSIAIAENQTAVYPAISPGGWNIIGNCPLKLFDPEQSPMIPFTIGSQVCFRPISREEFLDLGGECVFPTRNSAGHPIT